MKTLRFLFTLFLAIGLLLLGIGAYTISHTRQFLARALTAPGVVIENVWQESSSTSSSGSSGTYHPRVRFRTLSGQDLEFVSSVGSRPASYRAGEAVPVLYDPDNPNDASIHDFWSVWFVTVILLGLGVIFSSIGGVPLALQRRKSRQNEWLRANGQHLQTDFERVELNTSLTVNGSHPYRIICQCLDPFTNQVRVFKSENLWFDPTQYIPGKSLEVLIDPHNPKRYLVDTSFLPPMA